MEEKVDPAGLMEAMLKKLSEKMDDRLEERWKSNQKRWKTTYLKYRILYLETKYDRLLT